MTFAAPLGAGRGARAVVCVVGTAEWSAGWRGAVLDPRRPMVETHAFPDRAFFVENPGWMARGAGAGAGPARLAGDAAFDALGIERASRTADVTFVPAAGGCDDAGVAAVRARHAARAGRGSRAGARRSRRCSRGRSRPRRRGRARRARARRARCCWSPGGARSAVGADPPRQRWACRTTWPANPVRRAARRRDDRAGAAGGAELAELAARIPAAAATFHARRKRPSDQRGVPRATAPDAQARAARAGAVHPGADSAARPCDAALEAAARLSRRRTPVECGGSRVTKPADFTHDVGRAKRREADPSARPRAQQGRPAPGCESRWRWGWGQTPRLRVRSAARLHHGHNELRAALCADLSITSTT